MSESEPIWNVLGAPNHELMRSTAAQRVGELAARSNLFMAHYEHRVAMPLPEWWCPVGRPDLGEPLPWSSGVLPESKYQGFRHDRLIGSFHPSHRAKWTAHELCHGLVGFAWRPNASMLFHALAARLAEALPVALWYFFDEADGPRCQDHAGQGALSGPTCAACEVLGFLGPQERPDSGLWWERGQAWLEAELDAIRASILAGSPVRHPHPSIDLSSDGLAYASAQYARLSDPVFERYVSLFFEEGEGYFSSLEALEERVREVAGHVTGQSEARPLAGDTWRWISQDLGMRLVTLWVETEGEVAEALEDVVIALAEAPSEAGVKATIARYRELHADWVLPEPSELFALGYPISDEHVFSVPQVTKGLATACPRTLEALSAEAVALIERFVRDEAPETWVRRPLGRRFAAYLDGKAPEAVSDLARFEAALAYPAPVDPIAAAFHGHQGEGETLRFAEGLELLCVHHDVTEESVVRLDSPVYWALWCAADGDLRLLAISEAAAALLDTGGGRTFDRESIDLQPEEVALLKEHGVLVPTRWSLDVLPDGRL